MTRKIWIVILLLNLASCASRVQRKEWIQGSGSGYSVKARAVIIRDQYGVPHIRAENDQDLFFALGYAMAQDRFFQMDLMRRAGRGEICELMGRIQFWKADFLNMDKLFRALNYKGRAEQGYREMPAEAKRLLDSYSAGVNRYLQDAGDTIPQYHFFKSKPAAWRPEDSLVCADVFGLSMTYGQFGTEYYTTRFLREMGEKARVFIPIYPDDAPVIVKDLPVAKSDEQMDRLFSSLRMLLSLGMTPGSNNWVVAPEKSASGKPIIANDPHVPIYPLPTYWYHCQLEGGSFNIIGMMFPGIPAFGAAYNRDIAWALTNASLDQIDIFIEKLNPQNPNQYQYKGEWKDFSIREETIPLKRGKTFKYKVRDGIHGPVIDPAITGYPFPTGAADHAYAIKLVDVNFGKFLQGYLDMARSRNWDQYVKGLENMSQGPVGWNQVYADKDNNIGYWLTGHVPVRPDKQGYLARAGWTGEQDWAGYVPFSELPHMFNPGQKYIATANNKNFPDGYPYYLGTEYYVSRIQRIDEVLRSKTKFSASDMEKLQMDVAVVPARHNVPLLISDLSGSKNKKVEKAIKVLKQWREQGYNATVDSAGTCVYRLIMMNLDEMTFSDELGKLYLYVSNYGVTDWALPNIIDDPNNIWFDDQKTKQHETRKDLVELSAIEAVKYLEKKQSRDPAKWEWGKMSKTYFYTPFGIFPITGERHRIGKYPREGTPDTVNANVGVFLGPIGHIFVGGPTTRMVVDFAEPGHFHFTATTGNSENIQSGRCKNLTENWVKGQYQTLSMDRSEYEKGAMGVLELNP